MQAENMQSFQVNDPFRLKYSKITFINISKQTLAHILTFLTFIEPTLTQSRIILPPKERKIMVAKTVYLETSL